MSIANLQALKNLLRIQTTAEDSALTAILAAATALIETYLDRPIAALARTYTVEDRRAASFGLNRLGTDPAAATFIRVPDAPVDTTQPITITDRTGTVLDSTSYRVEAATGIVRGGSVTAPYSIGFSAFPYTITATTGLATRSDYATLVEPAINQAILDTAADLYQRRNASATDESDGAGGSVRYGRAEESIPNRALTFLDPYRRPQL